MPTRHQVRPDPATSNWREIVLKRGVLILLGKFVDFYKRKSAPTGTELKRVQHANPGTGKIRAGPARAFAKMANCG
jgi:hypothetical protein